MNGVHLVIEKVAFHKMSLQPAHLIYFFLPMFSMILKDQLLTQLYIKWHEKQTFESLKDATILLMQVMDLWNHFRFDYFVVSP